MVGNISSEKGILKVMGTCRKSYFNNFFCSNLFGHAEGTNLKPAK